MRITALSWSTAALLLSAGVLSGCNPASQICTTESKCGYLPSDQSESECETNNTDCLNALNAGAAACQQLAKDYSAAWSCEAGLSCTDLNELFATNSCSSEDGQLESDLEAAEAANCEMTGCSE